MQIHGSRQKLKEALKNSFWISVEKINEEGCLICGFDFLDDQDNECVFKFYSFEEEVSKEKDLFLREALLEVWKEIQAMDLTIYIQKVWDNFREREESKV